MARRRRQVHLTYRGRPNRRACKRYWQMATRYRSRTYGVRIPIAIDESLFVPEEWRGSPDSILWFAGDDF